MFFRLITLHYWHFISSYIMQDTDFDQVSSCFYRFTIAFNNWTARGNFSSLMLALLDFLISSTLWPFKPIRAGIEVGGNGNFIIGILICNEFTVKCGGKSWVRMGTFKKSPILSVKGCQQKNPVFFQKYFGFLKMFFLLTKSFGCQRKSFRY